MDNKELLKKLNYIDYSDEELSEIERLSLESELENKSLYWVKNDGVLRKITFYKLKEMVECKTKKGEDIKYQGIFYQSLLREKIHRYPLSPGLKAPIYLGIFITNLRVFIYKLTATYDIIEYEYINEITNIDYIQNSSEFSDTYAIVFNDKREMALRPLNNLNEKLIIEMMNYLEKEKNVLVKIEKVDPYHERLTSKKLLIIYFIWAIIVFYVFFKQWILK